MRYDGRMRYKTRYVHAINPSARDVGPDVELDRADVASSRSLAGALRRAGVLRAGARVTSYRVDRGGGIVLFPKLPGSTTYWHAVRLIPVETRGERAGRRLVGRRSALQSAARKRSSLSMWIFPDGKVFHTEAGATRYARRTGAVMPPRSRRGTLHGRTWHVVDEIERAAVSAARRRARSGRRRGEPGSRNRAM